MKLTTVQQKKFVQWLMTLFLVGVLAAIIYAYIYFGMMTAQNIETVQQEQIIPPATNDEKRQQMIDALAASEIPPVDVKKQEEMLNVLKSNPPAPNTDAKRQEMIDALNKNQI